MFQILISLIIFFCSSCNVWGDVLNKNGYPLPEVIKIGKKFQPDLPFNASLEKLNKLGQEKFLRPAKSERLSEKAIEHYKALCSHLSSQDQRDIVDSFRKIGDIKAVYPLHRNPDYILIQGSTISELRKRIMFFASLVEKGKIVLSPKTKIVFLMGDRGLFASETREVLLNPAPFKQRKGWQPPDTLPTNELELGEFAWAQLDLPPFLQEKIPLFVKAPKKLNATRAQTEDCVRAFLEREKVAENASFLIISSNPYVYYQKRVTELMFKKAGFANKGFRFEAAGNGTNLKEGDKIITIGILMDNLARTLYTETQFMNESIDK